MTKEDNHENKASNPYVIAKWLFVLMLLGVIAYFLTATFFIEVLKP